MSKNSGIQEAGHIPAIEAGKQFGYTNDYITKLARERRIVASRVGRQWFVDVDSLAAFVKENEKQKREYAERLRSERKRERVSFGTMGQSVRVTPVVPSRTPVLAKAGLALCAVLFVGSVAYAGTLSFVTGSGQTAGIIDALRTMALRLYGSSGGGKSAAIPVPVESQTASVVGTRETEGFVVVPQNDTRSMEEIQRSFSDEVRVEKDKDGMSGVITPVFKHASSTDYRYVMVPLNKAPD